MITFFLCPWRSQLLVLSFLWSEFKFFGVCFMGIFAFLSLLVWLLDFELSTGALLILYSSWLGLEFHELCWTRIHHALGNRNSQILLRLVVFLPSELLIWSSGFDLSLFILHDLALSLFSYFDRVIKNIITILKTIIQNILYKIILHHNRNRFVINAFLPLSWPAIVTETAFLHHG